MSRLTACLALSGAVIAALTTAAVAQDKRVVSGAVTYQDRMALPPDAVLLLEVRGENDVLQAEARIAATGAQVPVPFTLALSGEGQGVLRAGIIAENTVVWLGDPVRLAADATGDLGELLLQRFRPTGFTSALRCGNQLVQTGFVGDALVLDVDAKRLVLDPVPAASGARYVARNTPDTSFWSRGDSAELVVDGVPAPACRVSLPPRPTAYTAQGNEPFWSATADAETLALLRLGLSDLILPITQTGLNITGSITMTATDGALRAEMERRPAVCRDSMTGMPYPETVTLTLGDDVLQGCGGMPGSLLRGRTWQVTGIGGQPVIGDARTTLGFDSDGRVVGAGGCNRWFANYELTGENLTIGQAGASMMACPGPIMAQEAAFFAALGQVIGFDLDADGALVLRGPDGPVLTAVAATDGSAP